MTVGAATQPVGSPTTGGREALAGGRARTVLGVALVLVWGAWIVLTAMTQLRYVDPERFQDDLDAGRIATWRVITVDTGRNESSPWSTTVDYGVPAAEQDGNPIRERLGEVGGRPALAYVVDSPLARWRVVDPGSALDHTVAVEALKSAGIPPGFEVDDPALTDPPSDVATFPAIALAGLALVAFVVHRPTRGTRWFWFWFAWVSLGVGVIAYAVAELLRPAMPGDVPDDARRQPGIVGFALAVVASLVVAGSVRWLQHETHWLWVPTP